MYTETRIRFDTERRHLPVGELISLLERSTNVCEIAWIAGDLAASGEHRAVRPLLSRLGDPAVQRQPEAAEAVCDALVALDVMCPCGECGFAVRPRHVLAPDVVATIAELGTVPMRYLIARQA